MFSKGECVVALEALQDAGILTETQRDQFPNLEHLQQFANALLLVQQAKSELHMNLNQGFTQIIEKTTELLKGN